MTNKKQPELVSIEEAVARSIPSRIPNHESLIEIARAHPGYFGTTRTIFQDDEPHLFADLRVDFQKYLDAYQQLLANKRSVLDYTRLLDPKVKYALRNDKLDYRFTNNNWVPDSDDEENIHDSIRRLFGVTDHSYLDWALASGYSEEDFKGYLRQNVLPLFEPLNESGNNPYLNSCLVLKESYNRVDRIKIPTLVIDVLFIYPEKNTRITQGMSIPTLLFDSCFQIPRGNDEEDLRCFTGFQETVKRIIACPGIEELIFSTGDFGAFKPTYVRK